VLSEASLGMGGGTDVGAGCAGGCDGVWGLGVKEMGLERERRR